MCEKEAVEERRPQRSEAGVARGKRGTVGRSLGTQRSPTRGPDPTVTGLPLPGIRSPRIETLLTGKPCTRDLPSLRRVSGDEAQHRALAERIRPFRAG